MTEAEVCDQLYALMEARDLPAFLALLDAHPEVQRWEDGRDFWFGTAASAGWLELVRELVRRGTDVNEPASTGSATTPE